MTLGATYNFKQNGFAVGSTSYSKMNNEAQIYVTDRSSGKELIRANTKIDIDPLITYFGFGYHFQIIDKKQLRLFLLIATF